MSKVIKFKTSPVDSLPDDLMTYSEFAKRHGCSYHHIRNVVNFYGLEIEDFFGVKKVSEKVGCYYCKLYKNEKNKSQKLKLKRVMGV